MSKKKIESLTEAQWARIHELREEWWRIGTSCEPCDFPRTRSAIARAYATIDKPPPLVVLAPSPLGAHRLIAAWPKIVGEVGKMGMMGKPVLHDAGHRDFFLGALRDSVALSIGTAFPLADLERLKAAVARALEQSKPPKEPYTTVHWGQMDAYWIAFYVACGELDLQVPYTEEAKHKLQIQVDLASSNGWWWPFENVCVVSDRPELISWDDAERPRIHSEEGPAVRYRDGWEVYAIHGTVVPKHVVMAPETITLDQIRKETNAEVARIMRERFGEGRYLAESDAKLVDADFEGAQQGAAPRALFEDETGQRWLVGSDGSTERVYYMAVPGKPKTCRDAHVAVCGFDESRIVSKS